MRNRYIVSVSVPLYRVNTRVAVYLSMLSSCYHCSPQEFLTHPQLSLCTSSIADFSLCLNASVMNYSIIVHDSKNFWLTYSPFHRWCCVLAAIRVDATPFGEYSLFIDPEAQVVTKMPALQRYRTTPSTATTYNCHSGYLTLPAAGKESKKPRCRLEAPWEGAH